jgi:hypothetical protein
MSGADAFVSVAARAAIRSPDTPETIYSCRHRRRVFSNGRAVRAFPALARRGDSEA